MGYTHYWYRKAEGSTQEEWQDFTAIAAAIIEQAAKGDIALTGDSHGKEFFPVINESDLLCLNGYPFDNAHETFAMTRVPGNRAFTVDNGDEVFDCCKTAYKPYDVVVTALLIAAAWTLDGIRVSSDGVLDDWRNGARLYLAVANGRRDVEEMIDNVLDHPHIDLRETY